jgi:hypothetical protein
MDIAACWNALNVFEPFVAAFIEPTMPIQGGIFGIFLEPKLRQLEDYSPRPQWETWAQ